MIKLYIYVYIKIDGSCLVIYNYGSLLKIVDKFTYLGSRVTSTESDFSICLVKAWTAIDRLSVIWKSDLSDKIKRDFFQVAVVSILLYGCTKWMMTKHLEKKLDGNCTRMLWVILNKSWNQQPRNNSCMATYLPSLKPSK